MKMKKLMIWLPVAVCLLAVSCVAEKTESVTIFGTDEITAGIEVETPATKTYSEDLKVLWSEGDFISVFPKLRENSKYVLKSEPGKIFGVFTKDQGPLIGRPYAGYAAVYPYADDVAIASDGTITLTMPAEQTYAENTFGPGANTMVSWSDSGYLPFKNLGGFFVMPVTGNVEINSIEFVGGDEEILAGKATVVPGKEGPVITFDEAATDTSIVLTCPEPVKLDAETPTEFWIVVPPASYGMGVYVKVTYNGDQVFQGSPGEKTVNIVRNEIFRMETLDITVDNRIDLSAEVTSNCYIVTSQGSYKFKTVQGNTEDSLGEVASAVVLWESFNNDVAPQVGDLISSVKYEDGYIFFDYTGELGNALIAAKDQAGTIMWSWHIWCSPVDASAMNQVYAYRNAGSWGESATMMDRNLGAISGVPGDVGFLGLMYQWGRKDPFVGGNSISSNTMAAISTAFPAPVDSSPETGTIEYSIQNPMQYIMWNPNTIDWLWAEPGVYADTERWGGNVWGNPKSKYDPCPPGYKVPFSNGKGEWICAMGTTYMEDGSLYDTSTNCMDLTDALNCDTPVYYPMTGYMLANEFRLYGVGLQTLMNSTSSYYSNALYFDLRWNGYINAHTKNGKVCACSVRCLKERK